MAFFRPFGMMPDLEEFLEDTLSRANRPYVVLYDTSILGATPIKKDLLELPALQSQDELNNASFDVQKEWDTHLHNCAHLAETKLNDPSHPSRTRDHGLYKVQCRRALLGTCPFTPESNANIESLSHDQIPESIANIESRSDDQNTTDSLAQQVTNQIWSFLKMRLSRGQLLTTPEEEDLRTLSIRQPDFFQPSTHFEADVNTRNSLTRLGFDNFWETPQ